MKKLFFILFLASIFSSVPAQMATQEAITLSEETAVPVTVDYDHNNGPIYYFVNLESGMLIKFQDKHGTIEYIEYTVTAELLTKILIFLEYNGYVCDSGECIYAFLITDEDGEIPYKYIYFYTSNGYGSLQEFW